MFLTSGKAFSGLAIAGVSNMFVKFEGSAYSFALNAVKDGSKGAVYASLFNLVEDFDGLMVAGLMNKIVGRSSGLSIAPVTVYSHFNGKILSIVSSKIVYTHGLGERKALAFYNYDEVEDHSLIYAILETKDGRHHKLVYFGIAIKPIARFLKRSK